jgi:hypothetical protein
MNKKTVRHVTSLVSALAMALGLSVAGWAAQSSRAPSGNDEFFIVTSTNMPKHQLVLKLPTEVTMRMYVNDKTRVIGENGKSMPVSQLQAGDTAFITYVRGSEGPTAVEIRLGPMTWSILQQRYLSGYSEPVQPPPLAPILHPGAQPKQGAGVKQASHRGNFPRHKPHSQTK